MRIMILCLAVLLNLSVYSKDCTTLDQVIAEGILRHNDPNDFQGNIERISERFLGRPYDRTGPLGEGEKGKYDKDPLFRLDRFDCCTFVETVTALAVSKDFGEFMSNIVRIRYRNSTVSYITRKHFTSLTWIPDNIANGLLTDITELVIGKGRALMAEAVIDRKAWYLKKKAGTLKLPGITENERTAILVNLKSEGLRFYPRKATVPYAPVQALLAEERIERNMHRIPSGSICNIVRPNWDLRKNIGSCLNISHQGFLIRQHGKVYFRHASSSGKVKQDLLSDYMERYMDHPTVKGINILRVVQE